MATIAVSVPARVQQDSPSNSFATTSPNPNNISSPRAVLPRILCCSNIQHHKTSITVQNSPDTQQQLDVFKHLTAGQTATRLVKPTETVPWHRLNQNALYAVISNASRGAKKFKGASVYSIWVKDDEQETRIIQIPETRLLEIVGSVAAKNRKTECLVRQEGGMELSCKKHLDTIYTVYIVKWQPAHDPSNVAVGPPLFGMMTRAEYKEEMGEEPPMFWFPSARSDEESLRPVRQTYLDEIRAKKTADKGKRVASEDDGELVSEPAKRTTISNQRRINNHPSSTNNEVREPFRPLANTGYTFGIGAPETSTSDIRKKPWQWQEMWAEANRRRLQNPPPKHVPIQGPKERTPSPTISSPNGTISELGDTPHSQNPPSIFNRQMVPKDTTQPPPLKFVPSIFNNPMVPKKGLNADAGGSAAEHQTQIPKTPTKPTTNGGNNLEREDPLLSSPSVNATISKSASGDGVEFLMFTVRSASLNSPNNFDKANGMQPGAQGQVEPTASPDTAVSDTSGNNPPTRVGDYGKPMAIIARVGSASPPQPSSTSPKPPVAVWDTSKLPNSNPERGKSYYDFHPYIPRPSPKGIARPGRLPVLDPSSPEPEISPNSGEVMRKCPRHQHLVPASIFGVNPKTGTFYRTCTPCREKAKTNQRAQAARKSDAAAAAEEDF